MFRRRPDRNDGVSEDALEGEHAPEQGPVTADDARAGGPWDDTEVDDVEGLIDVGSIRVRGVPGLSMQVQMDESTQTVRVVTLVLQDAAVQVQAFAAPRSAGLWDEVRPQIMSSITTGGGLVEEATGRFGVELRAQVRGQDGALQPARFVGVDGPRWFLRGLFLGAAASRDGHVGLEDVFANLVVVRGNDARASGEALPLTVPQGTAEGATPA